MADVFKFRRYVRIPKPPRKPPTVEEPVPEDPVPPLPVQPIDDQLEIIDLEEEVPVPVDDSKTSTPIPKGDAVDQATSPIPQEESTQTDEAQIAEEPKEEPIRPVPLPPARRPTPPPEPQIEEDENADSMYWRSSWQDKGGGEIDVPGLFALTTQQVPQDQAPIHMTPKPPVQSAENAQPVTKSGCAYHEDCPFGCKG